MSKLTKKEKFNLMKGIVESAEISVEDREIALDFIANELELLAKKSSKSVETKTQKENVGIKATICEVLSAFGKPVTIKEMLATDELGAYSNQKLSALLTQLVKENMVAKTYDKKTPMFELV
jgi:hypothetical protein